MKRKGMKAWMEKIIIFKIDRDAIKPHNLMLFLWINIFSPYNFFLFEYFPPLEYFFLPLKQNKKNDEEKNNMFMLHVYVVYNHLWCLINLLMISINYQGMMYFYFLQFLYFMHIILDEMKHH